MTSSSCFRPRSQSAHRLLMSESTRQSPAVSRHVTSQLFWGRAPPVARSAIGLAVGLGEGARDEGLVESEREGAYARQRVPNERSCRCAERRRTWVPSRHRPRWRQLWVFFALRHQLSS